jgi:cellulose synthase/poly-beta-1,6-N-acetylglucosamine synthase-like glycosyltransferase
MLLMFLKIVFALILIATALSVLYLLLLAISSRFLYRRPFADKQVDGFKRVAVMVPAYKEDGIIVSTARYLLRQHYPETHYTIFIIADSFKPETIRALAELPIRVIEVSFEKSTKTKALNEAFARIQQSYDIALICDADNILASDFLQKINAAFQQGAHAVQGRRVAKNLDTSFSILDACSEGINNNIFRKGTYGLGLSSAVIGSGMAFDYESLKKIMAQMHAVSGFDKILQLRIVAQGHRIHYLEDALIFDEKVDSAHAFQQQRKRWVSSQFIYLRDFFPGAMKRLLKGNVSYFNLAILNNLVPPRAFLFLLLPLLVGISFFLGVNWLIAASSILLLFVVSMLLTLPKELVNRDLVKAISRLPSAIFMMVGAVLKIRQSNKSFIHTIHTKTEISNPLFHEHIK